MATKTRQQPKLHPFNHSRHQHIYPMANPLGRGYGVDIPRSPLHKTNARFINLLGEYIDFYVEDIQANVAVAGTTGQSRAVRQFFPHNMVQPSINVSGTAPNSHQYNRLSAFIRVSQHLALAGLRIRNDAMASHVRHRVDSSGRLYIIDTIRFLISNGTRDFNIASGRHTKGIHKPWKLEGYVKSMPAGAERFQQAPPFQFEFLVAESLSGIWSDHAVLGDQIRSWTVLFGNGKKGFVHPPKPKSGGKGKGGGKGGGKSGPGGSGGSGGTVGHPAGP